MQDIEGLRRYSRDLIHDERFKALLQHIKHVSMGDWEGEMDSAKRENLWRDVQAINRLAVTVRQFHDDKTMDDKKEAHARAKFKT